MLPLPELNHQELNTILYSAINELKKNGQGWTDFDVHDPGITFLELLSVLKSGQMKQMDTITEKSLEKYLKLLDLKRQNETCATAKASFSAAENRFLPKGYRLQSGQIVYETKQPAVVLANRIVDCGCGSEATCSFYPYEEQNLERKMTVFKTEELCYYIGFEKPLPAQTEIRFYFALQDFGVKRNPPSADFIPLSTVVWEYFDGKGWQRADVICDDTYGFLYSGNVVLKICGDHAQTQRDDGAVRFDIRARCTKYGYEVSPELAYFMLNSVDLVQKNTYCETVSFTHADFQRNQMMIRSFIANENLYELYIRSGDAFVRAEELDVAYLLLDETIDGRRLATSQRSTLAEMFQKLPTDAAVLLFVMYRQDFYDSRKLGISNSAANQEFEVVQYKNLVYDDFAIMTGNAQLGWQVWAKAAVAEPLSARDCKYILNAKNAAIRFGDNRNGAVPLCGSDIVVTSMADTLLENGNIRENVLQNPNEDGIGLFHFMAGTGGRQADAVAELIDKIRYSLKNVSRAVTEQDYKTLALRTPGLKIGAISVLKLYKPDMKHYPQNKEKNAVTIVVAPAVFTENPVTIQGYIQNIKKYLHQYRLLTTRLYVIATVYIPIDVYLEMRIAKKTIESETYVREKISSYFAETTGSDSGMVLYYGGLCAMLERLENVENIKYLQMETPYEKAERTGFGDIRIPQYGKAYLRKCDIIFY